MEIIKTGDFDGSFKKLPRAIQDLYSVQEKRFRENWRDSRLHVKKVRSLPLAFSFRITRRYRVFFYFQTPEIVIFFDMDHRKDIYK